MIAYRCHYCGVLLQDEILNDRCSMGHFVKPELDNNNNQIIITVTEERWLQQKMNRE